MTVLNTQVLHRFARKHLDAAAAIERWVELAESAESSSLIDVRRVFPSADGFPVAVKGFGTLIATVFNIRDNEYRLITVLDFAGERVIIRDLLTHPEYSKGTWKNRL